MYFSSQRHLRTVINARLRDVGWNSRKHYAEFAFGTLSGKQYPSYVAWVLFSAECSESKLCVVLARVPPNISQSRIDDGSQMSLTTKVHHSPPTIISFLPLMRTSPSSSDFCRAFLFISRCCTVRSHPLRLM